MTKPYTLTLSSGPVAAPEKFHCRGTTGAL